MGQFFSTSFWTGVGSSLAVVIFLWLSRAAIEKILRNFYQRMLQEQLTDISGKWQGEQVKKQGYDYVEVMDLTQRGKEIKGVLHYEETPNSDLGRTAKKDFSLTGIYRERTLTAYYQTTDQRSLSAGCLTVQLVDDISLNGGCIYYDGSTNEVVNDNYNWKRLP